jgi:hypothetical protein
MEQCGQDVHGVDVAMMSLDVMLARRRECSSFTSMHSTSMLLCCRVDRMIGGVYDGLGQAEDDLSPLL